jgi:L-histidine N-alpha-methyltransferase
MNERVRIDVHQTQGGDAALTEVARKGLSREFKELPPKFFYDERGSQLFERITELPEYYPTRAERKILELHVDEIVEAAEGPADLVELGSGSASKTHALLDAMRSSGRLRRYVPVDISEGITRESAQRLVREYPGLEVHGVICDFEHHLERLPDRNGGSRLIAFLGGTIGNFAGPERDEFLSQIGSLMSGDDRLLLGTDLVKDPARLEAAYNDSAGITAEFNKNVLLVLNRELGANFEPDRFEHVARYDEEEERVDIRLRSLADQKVRLDGLEMEVEFAEGEEMRTELSCKFTPRSLERAYGESGLTMTGLWTDPEDLFALSLASPASDE